MTTFERYFEENPDQKEIFDKKYKEFLISEIFDKIINKNHVLYVYYKHTGRNPYETRLYLYHKLNQITHPVREAFKTL